MEVIQTEIPDVKIVKPKVYGDERGFFLETFEQKRYQEMLGINLNFVQDNHSRSQKNVLRGLHFQKENPQGKLVRVVRGEVFDVAVDIRKIHPLMVNGLVLFFLKRIKINCGFHQALLMDS